MGLGVYGFDFGVMVSETMTAPKLDFKGMRGEVEGPCVYGLGS